jgi:two-component system response regulator FixJ
MAESPKRIYFFGKELQLSAVLEPALTPHRTSIHSFSRPQDCLRELSDKPCDLLIVDLDGCEAEGLDMLAEVRRMAPWISSLVLVGHAAVHSAVKALKAGARDCLEKPVRHERLLEVIKMQLGQIAAPVGRPGRSLTRKEVQILQLILDGMTSQDMARELHRSKRTIDVHRKNIMRKLEASCPADLIRRALGMGFIDSPE